MKAVGDVDGRVVGGGGGGVGYPLGQDDGGEGAGGGGEEGPEGDAVDYATHLGSRYGVVVVVVFAVRGSRSVEI